MPGEFESTQGKKKWCVMVYLAADIDLESAALADLEQMKAAGSSSQVDLLAQLNPGGSRVVRRFHLQKDTYLEEDRVTHVNENGQEVILHNKNPKQDLIDFVEWCASRSQAEHYALVLWGHAQGWKADAVDPCSVAGAVQVRAFLEEAIAAKDDSFPITRASFPTTLVNGETGFLTNADLTEVLGKARSIFNQKLDVLGLDACMMAMAEICYQVSDSVNYLVACEETLPNESWPYDSILKLLVTHAERMQPEEFSRTIVWKFVFDFGRKKKYVTQSILCLGADHLASLNNFSGAVTRLVQALVTEMRDPEVRWAIMTARSHVQSFYIREYVDLYDFCRLLSINCSSKWILSSCQDVMHAIAGSPAQNGSGPANKLVIDYGTYGYPLKRSFGVSVYFPCVGTIPACYPQLEFCKRTQWDKFLNAFLNSPNGNVARDDKPVVKTVKPSSSEKPVDVPEVEPLSVGVGVGVGVGEVAFMKKSLGVETSHVMKVAMEKNETIVSSDVSNNNGIKTTHNDEIKTTYGDVIKTTHGDPIKTPTLPVWMLPTPPKTNTSAPPHRAPAQPVKSAEDQNTGTARRCNCGGDKS